MREMLADLWRRFRGVPTDADRHAEWEDLVRNREAARESLRRRGFTPYIGSLPPRNEVLRFEREDGQSFTDAWNNFDPAFNVAGLWWKPFTPIAPTSQAVAQNAKWRAEAEYQRSQRVIPSDLSQPFS